MGALPAINGRSNDVDAALVLHPRHLPDTVTQQFGGLALITGRPGLLKSAHNAWVGSRLPADDILAFLDGL
jgi:hypothetical protein